MTLQGAVNTGMYDSLTGAEQMIYSNLLAVPQATSVMHHVQQAP